RPVVLEERRIPNQSSCSWADSDRESDHGQEVAAPSAFGQILWSQKQHFAIVTRPVALVDGLSQLHCLKAADLVGLDNRKPIPDSGSGQPVDRTSLLASADPLESKGQRIQTD